MAKRAALMVILVAALLAGCTGAESAGEDTVEGAGSEATTPVESSPRATVATCEELADEVIAQVQVIVDELSDATLDDLQQDDVLPSGTQQQLDDLETRVEDAGCDDDEMDRLLAARANRIQGDGIIAEAVREGLSESGDLPF